MLGRYSNHFDIFKEMQHYILFLPKDKWATLGLSSLNWGILFRSVHYWWYLCLLSNLTDASFESYIFFFPHRYVLVCNDTPQHYKTGLYQQTYTADHLPLKKEQTPKAYFKIVWDINLVIISFLLLHSSAWTTLKIFCRVCLAVLGVQERGCVHKLPLLSELLYWRMLQGR